MHPRKMSHSAVGLAAGTLCSLLMACAAHDDAPRPAPPPGGTTPSDRTIVDAGLVILSEDAGGGIPGVGGTGDETPDAAVLPDSSADAPAPDVVGRGSTCDSFAPDPCETALSKLGCYLSPTTGNATCQDPAGRDLPAYTNCSPASSLCGPQLFCGSGMCANLCHLNVEASITDCAAGTICTRIGLLNTIGFCE